MTATTPADAGPLTGRRAVVVTCSTRAATGVYPDRGGALLVEALRGWGCDVADATVFPQDVVEACQTLDAKGAAHARERERIKTGHGY